MTGERTVPGVPAGNHTCSLNRHIMPTFGGCRVVDVLPVDVREWVAKLTGQSEAS